jgi:hypothetical protein
MTIPDWNMKAFGGPTQWNTADSVVPITISPAPAPMLQQMGVLGPVPNPAPVTLRGGGSLGPPPQGFMVLPPQAYYGAYPPDLFQPESVGFKPDTNQSNFADKQQDINNFGGLVKYNSDGPLYPNMTPYAQQAPMYPLPPTPQLDTTGLKASSAQVAPEDSAMQR